MRSGQIVQLIGDFDGDLGSLRTLLAAQGFQVADGTADGATDAGSTIRLTALSGRLSLDELHQRRAILASDGAVSAALLPTADPALIAMAAAIDCDDVMVWPVAGEELIRRLQNLCGLARLRRERTLRQRVFGKFRAPPEGMRHWTPPRQLQVIFIGAPGAAGSRLAEMVKPAQVVFAEHGAAAIGHLREVSFDLIVAARALADQGWLDQPLPAHAKRIWLTDTEQDQLRRRQPASSIRWFDDVLPADLPSDLLRARMRLLRRLATIGQELTDPPPERVPDAVLDEQTGCFNASFARAYLAERTGDSGRPFTQLDLVPTDLGGLVAEIGFAGLAAWFPQIGRALVRRLRCDDLICHLGEGHFQIVLQHTRAAGVDKVARRLIATSAGRLQRQPATTPTHVKRQRIARAS